MNEVEQETIILNSAWEMIGGMINWTMFLKFDRIHPTSMMFKTKCPVLLFAPNVL